MVIGGLVSSTLLTLVLVPTLYTMVENRKEKRRARRAARRAAKGLPAEQPRHAADEPGADVPVGVAPDSSGGAHEVPAAQPSGALRGYTDQFEVLKVSKRPNEAK